MKESLVFLRAIGLEWNCFFNVTSDKTMNSFFIAFVGESRDQIAIQLIIIILEQHSLLYVSIVWIHVCTYLFCVYV